jgi:hypothetical protein
MDQFGMKVRDRPRYELKIVGIMPPKGYAQPVREIKGVDLLLSGQQ